jgi:enamine deaminase RidA (YjgF/YER057c/UK114 family)
VTTETPWRRIDPPELARPVGYSHAVESRGGRRISLAGQVAMGKDGNVLFAGDLVAQAGRAFENLLAVLRAAGAKPEHLVRLRIYTNQVDAYAAKSREIGDHYRRCFGRWFPAMTLVGVARLFDPVALIEVEGEAVVPE